jgi:DNA polymerase I
MEFLRITSEREAKVKLRYLPRIVAVDTEYSSLDVRNAELISVIVSNGEVTHSYPKELAKLVGESLQTRDLLFMQNHVVDVFMLKKHGCDLSSNNIFDTMLAHHLIDENENHGLGDMVKKYFGDEYKKEFWGKYESIEAAPEDERLIYECKDGYYTYKLGMMFVEQLRGKEALLSHVTKLQQALFETEVRGVKVNVELIRETKQTMGAEIESYLPRLASEFRDHTVLFELNKWQEELNKRKTEKGKLGVKRPEFSFTSDKQIKWLVYDALQCPVTEKTKTGQPSTSYETLEALSETYSELKTLVEYKGAKTVYSTFVEGMLDRVDNNRIYPRFNVNGTTTGRISHSNPNLANIPRDGVIRSFFIPDDGYCLIGADFSQLEVIVEANLTKDSNLVRIINEGVSKHDITSEGLGIGRDQAKTLNFALQYGAGTYKVSKILGVSHKDAQDIFRRYWELYSGVKTLKDETCRLLSEHGYITNLFGRTRHFSKPQNDFEKGKQERVAYNFLIQGVGADLCNKAFYEYHSRLKLTSKGQTQWSVHDEILAQVKPEYAEEEKVTLVKTMTELTQFIGFEFPLQAKSYGPLTAWAKT